MARTVSRRVLFVSLGAAAMGLALTNRARNVAAEEADPTFVLVNRDWHGDLTRAPGGPTAHLRPGRRRWRAWMDGR